MYLLRRQWRFDFVSGCWTISKAKLLQGEMQMCAHSISPWKSEVKGCHKLAKYTQFSLRLGSMFISLKDRELDIKNPSISVFKSYLAVHWSWDTSFTLVQSTGGLTLASLAAVGACCWHLQEHCPLARLLVCFLPICQWSCFTGFQQNLGSQLEGIYRIPIKAKISSYMH